MANEQAQVTTPPAGDNSTGDFMMDTLSEFNKGHSGSPDENQAGQDVSAEDSADSQQQMTAQEKENWLIDNKFRDTPEGREKLANSYKQLQSEKDRITNEAGSNSDRYKQLDQLDTFLHENPEIVEKLRGEISNVSQETKPPEKPEDYDPYEENIDGSSSQKYRQDYDKYLVSAGANEAKKELAGFRQELAAKEAVQAEEDTLRNLGLSQTDIKEYRDFINDPNIVTPENLVNIWRYMSEQRKKETVPDKLSANQPSGSGGRTSVASVSGVTPSPINSPTKETNEFMDGIMQFSNNYTPDKRK